MAVLSIHPLRSGNYKNRRSSLFDKLFLLSLSTPLFTTIFLPSLNHSSDPRLGLNQCTQIQPLFATPRYADVLYNTDRHLTLKT